MQIVPKEDMKNMREKVKEKNKGLPEKTKGTRAEEKKQRLRGEMKGADSANGEMHEEIVKCEREIKDYGGEYKAQGLRRKCKC